MAAKRKHEEPTREAPVPVSASTPRIVIGRLVVGSTPAHPMVDFGGNTEGPLRARTTVVLDATTIDLAVVTHQGAMLLFENGDPRLPIVAGLLQTEQATTPFQDLLVSTRSAPPQGTTRPNGRAPLEARLDGERVVLEGRKEIVLKCGEASITLRRDGKMVLRGAYVETYSKGVNRIKGGSVKIN